MSRWAKSIDSAIGWRGAKATPVTAKRATRSRSLSAAKSTATPSMSRQRLVPSPAGSSTAMASSTWRFVITSPGAMTNPVPA